MLSKSCAVPGMLTGGSDAVTLTDWFALEPSESVAFTIMVCDPTETGTEALILALLPDQAKEPSTKTWGAVIVAPFDGVAVPVTCAGEFTVAPVVGALIATLAVEVCPVTVTFTGLLKTCPAESHACTTMEWRSVLNGMVALRFALVPD